MEHRGSMQKVDTGCPDKQTRRAPGREHVEAVSIRPESVRFVHYVKCFMIMLVRCFRVQTTDVLCRYFREWPVPRQRSREKGACTLATKEADAAVVFI